MRSSIQRWGNSLALRIPKHVAEEVGMASGAAVELRVEQGELRVKPVEEGPYTLDALLAGVTPDNLHGEIDSGGSVGEEAW